MKNKIKIFITLGITLITTLIFTVSTFAQIGYEITDNGNIESLNLLDYNNRLTNKALDNNGNIVNNQYGAYVIDNIPLQANTTYTCNITNGGGLAQFDSNMNFISLINIITTQTFTTSNNATYFRMDATPNNTQPMLNIGNTLLDYFPYGNYTNNKYIGNNGQIYEQLNGTTAKLFQTNITNINTALNTQGIIEETININNQTSYTWNSNSIPTIKNCIINYNPAIDLGNRATILLQLKNATIFNDLTFSRIDKNEDRYIYLYNEDKKLITTLTIARKVETITQKI